MRCSLALLGCAVACLLALLQNPVGADEPAVPAVNHLVDAALQKVWEAESVRPAELSSDAEFLRRVYLDTTGAPPTRAEAKAFLGDTDPAKREKLIDALVADPRFGRYLADYWTAAIRGRGAGQLNGSDLFAAWFAARVNAGAGFHEIWSEIVTAKGNLADAPAISVFFNDNEPRDLRDVSGHLSKVLTGVQIQCAQCHKHPYENIEVADFNGMTSFFIGAVARVNNDIRPARVTLTESDENVRRIKEALRKRDSLPKDQQALVDLYAQFIKPRTLDGKWAESQDPRRWRGELARWLVGAGNRQDMM